MTECESIRGEWGDICPDCDQRLPAKQGPLRSWQSEREVVPTPRRDAVSKPAAPRHPGGTPRDLLMLEAAIAYEGSRTRAARHLGISTGAISHAITRLAARGDARAIALRTRGQRSDPDHLTPRQREALRMLTKHDGNRHAAARELGISGPSMFSMIERLRDRGVAVPAA